MKISLGSVARNHELSASEVEPVMANVKYAQLSDVEIAPIVENVKYAQLSDEDIMAFADAV